MVKLRYLDKQPLDVLNIEGWKWLLGEDTLPYVAHQVVEVKESEAEAYYEAANTLYEMYCEAAQKVVDENRFKELGIPENMIPLIKYTWENDNHWHLYGRFDLSGGLNRQAIKLIEFNADTATCIPETSIVQWASLKANGLDDSKQFNTLFSSLVNNFIELKAKNIDKEAAILFTSMEGYPEDDANVQVLQEAAKSAGFETDFAFMHEVVFADDGIYKDNQNETYTRYDFWFKLVPWEYLAWDEPDLINQLSNLVLSGKTVIVNPAYVLLFQSKMILKVLWEMYPYHPLLLHTDTKPLYLKKCVQKVLFGREGANVKILSMEGKATEVKGGEYGDQPSVYQEYVPFLQDQTGNRYQAGVFFAGEACGLGYRLGGEIIDNKGQFCGHLVV